MKCNYLLSQILKIIFIFSMTVNAWAIVEPPSCTAQAQILDQSETDSADSADDEEEDEEPECD